ncbi:MAG: RNA methyltransferase [Prevotellaceae bacterium]|nr:RNA methyltransferase [Prevotellaceae bacterium]
MSSTNRVVTSLQNPKVKRLLALQRKPSERDAQGVFVLEGWRELGHCLRRGLSVEAVYYCPEVAGSEHCLRRGSAALGKSSELVCSHLHERCLSEIAVPEDSVWLVTPEVYSKMAYRGGTEGVMAEVRYERLRLQDLRLSPEPLVVVLESVEKPGNLGAVLRSADAAGADAVIVCDPRGDLYNPNVVRSSLGSIFTVPCVSCSSEECVAFLKGRGISILTAQLQDSELYYETDMRRACAIVLGSEAKGLTELWRRAADAHIRIPMLGELDSLNVSVSAAILLFEAVRQRRPAALSG